MNRNRLQEMYRAEQKARATHDRTVRAMTRWGVFVWTGTNRYPEMNAIKVYRSRAAAEAFAGKNLDLNYVVRPII